MPDGWARIVAVASLLLVASNGAAGAQTAVLEGRDAFGSWQQDKPGAVRLIRPADLPHPGASRSAANMSRVVARPAGAAG